LVHGSSLSGSITEVRGQMTDESWKGGQSSAVVRNRLPSAFCYAMRHALCAMPAARKTRLNKTRAIAVTLMISVLVGACGYRFAEQEGLPGGGHRLFVKVFQNRTQETGVENIFTAALLSELTLRKTDELVGSMDNADVVLSGVVEEVSIGTIAARTKDTASERRVAVTVNVKLSKQEGGVVWAAKGFSDNEAYRVDDNPERTDQNRRDAIRLLSRRIAEKVVNRLSDNF
jgi:hypothetical protein